MKRVLSFGAVAVALVLVVPSASANAQGKLSGFAAFGGSTTAGDLKGLDSTKTGFLGQVGLEYKISDPLWLRADASMGWNDRETLWDEDAFIWTLAARLEYWIPMGSEKIRPYVLGGAGLMLYKRNPGATGIEDSPEMAFKRRALFSGGAGLDYQIGGTSVFVEGRYDMGAGNRAYVPIVLGARWGAR